MLQADSEIIFETYTTYIYTYIHVIYILFIYIHVIYIFYLYNIRKLFGFPFKIRNNFVQNLKFFF